MPAPPLPNPPDPSQPAVIGTAGHVDHGKSTLVKALTGIDPDRLAEEQTRSMTIDLGFAWLTLPSGRQVSVVDVPGHERFIKNMLAGVGGIDIAMLVIAADEGFMPQTEEHLSILNLLDVPNGIVVLTKSDAVTPEWMDLMTLEVRERLAGSVLKEAPILPVSATIGVGLDDLCREIDELVAQLPPRGIGSRPRLPIDRAFSIAGFGTVVTGTLLGGHFEVGQAVRIEPSGLNVRIRGLQAHQQKMERVAPGSRVAVNIVGATVDQIRRGDVLAPEGLIRPTQRIDVHLSMLAEAPVRLEQNDEVDVFTGAAEIVGRVTLLDRPYLDPGETGWVQIRLREPLAVLSGDRFIIRRPSPSQTIGGGVIVDPHPVRHKRFRAEVIGALETRAQGSPAELVLQMIDSAPREIDSLWADLPSINPVDRLSILAQLLEDRVAVLLGGSTEPLPGIRIISAAHWASLATAIEEELAAFHANHPQRKGMPREALRAKLALPHTKDFDDVVKHAVVTSLLVDEGSTLRLPTFSIKLDPAQEKAASSFLQALAESPFSPPAAAELGVTVESLAALESQGLIVRVNDAISYSRGAYETIVRDVITMIDQQGSLTLAAYRDHFATSRKYAQATLEYLDQQRITRRVGDDRVRGQSAGKRED